MTTIYKTDEGKKKVIRFYENILRQWPQPSGSYTIETTSGDTFIIESGVNNSRAVILLHGSGSNSGMWTADVQKLSKSYHVYAIDIPGECGKSSENRLPFKGENYSGWLSEIIEKLRLNKVSLTGCSIGGWIAMDFAIRHPEKTEKLVLLATAGIVQVKLKTIIRILITSFSGTRGFNKLNKMVYGNLDIDDKTLEFAALINRYFKPRAEVLPVISEGSLQKIEAPTLFIGGEHDCFYNTHKTAARLKRNLKNIQCVVLKNTGHVLLNQTGTMVQFLNS